MIKTMKEFQDDLRVIRQEMYDFGETADTEMVASWLDRLVISLDKLSVSLDLMAVEVETLSKRPAEKMAMKKAKKPAKKKAMKRAKKSMKKKRRR